MTNATIDTLASDSILAYVPGVTPEGEGVSVVYDAPSERWYVEGGESFRKEDKQAAIAQAVAIAEKKWGAA